MNENEIINLGEQYGLKCQVVGDSVYVYTFGNGEWYFKLSDVKINNIRLYHKNAKDNKKFHVQRIFKDINFMFNSIFEHVKFHNTPYKKSRMETLYEKISSEKIKNNKKKSKFVS